MNISGKRHFLGVYFCMDIFSSWWWDLQIWSRHLLNHVENGKHARNVDKAPELLLQIHIFFSLHFYEIHLKTFNLLNKKHLYDFSPRRTPLSWGKLNILPKVIHRILPEMPKGNAIPFRVMAFIMWVNVRSALFFPLRLWGWFILNILDSWNHPKRIMFQLPQLTYSNSMWKIYGILNLFINFRLRMTDAARFCLFTMVPCYCFSVNRLLVLGHCFLLQRRENVEN